MSDQPLYTHGPYTVTRRAGRLVILENGFALPDEPVTLSEAIAFIADYCECPVCEGKGTTPCRVCKGDGYIPVTMWDYHEGDWPVIPHPYYTSRICPDCLGRGWTRCPRCKGSGDVTC